MSNYEDRMAEKYNFLKKDKSEENIPKEDASNEEKITHVCLYSTTMLRNFMKAEYEQRLQY